MLFRKTHARQRARESLLQLAKEGRVLAPRLTTAVPCAYISIPAHDIPKLADEYISAMETQETNDWCRCEWIIHPDDVAVPANHCRVCRHSKGHFQHSEEAKDHEFRARRMRRGDQAPDCPVHTREGLVIYFFEWVFTRGKN